VCGAGTSVRESRPFSPSSLFMRGLLPGLAMPAVGSGCSVRTTAVLNPLAREPGLDKPVTKVRDGAE
jgi:hypothetical protein